MNPVAWESGSNWTGGKAVVLSWPAMIESDFVTLLQKRDQFALVILAHYAAVLHTLGSLWWCRGWGFMLLKDVIFHLEDNKRTEIQWPIQQIGLQIT